MIHSRFHRFRPLAAVLVLFIIFGSGITAAGKAPDIKPADSSRLDLRPPAGAPPHFPTMDPGQYTVTLITGHKVHVHVDDDGSAAVVPAAAVESDGAPGPSLFRTVETDEGLYVIPGEADGLVPRLLDEELFNVAYLISHGYHDEQESSIPVIVAGAPHMLPAEMPDMASLQAGLPGFTGFRAFTSIPAAAGRFHKGPRLAELTAALASDSSGIARSGVEKIWLDRKVFAALEDSAPQVGAPAAWQAGFDGSGVTVAILDTGIDTGHPDLAGKVVMAENFTDTADAGDYHGHGTHVAGIVAGTGAASGGLRRGVAPGAALINGKVLGDDGVGTSSWIIAGMEWAAARADIINLSLGAAATDGTDPMSLALNNLAEQHDVLFVVAAGNAGPRPYSVGSPGAADRALTVGNVEKNGELRGSSSRGPRLGDHAIKPEMTAPGTGIASARAAGTSLGPVVDEYYTRTSGTSMAAPHVAGAAALLLQQEPGMGGARLKTVLAATAVPGPEMTVYEQGGGRLHVPGALAARVVPDRATLDMGLFPYDGDGPESFTETLVYSNTGDGDISLHLSVDVADENGEPAPPAAVTLDTYVLTVPAGGEAAVEVTAHGGAVGYGLYGGYLTAAGPDGPELRTPVGFYKEGEMVDITVLGTARDGRPAHGSSRVEVMNVDDAGIFESSEQFVDGTALFRVPPGTYSINAFIYTYNQAGTNFTEIAYAGEPEIEVTADTVIQFDMTGAAKIELVTPEPAEANSVSVGYGRGDVRGSRRHFAIHTSRVGDAIYTTPTAPVTKGFFEFYSRYVMAAPLIHMAAVQPEGPELDVSYLKESPVFEGELETGLVFAGIGRAEDFHGLDAEGKIVLMELGHIAPAEKAQNAAAAGAVAAVIHYNKPGKFSASLGGEGVIPTFALSMEQGLELRSMLAGGQVSMSMFGAPVSPYTYDLVLPESGIAGDLTYTVGENAPVAAVEVAYRADEDDLEQTSTRHFWRPYAISSFDYARPHDAPFTRREYVSAGDTRFRQEVRYRRYSAAYQTEPSRMYGEGEEASTVWWQPAVGPGFREGGPWDAPVPTQRQRDTLYLNVAEVTGGSRGHWGPMDGEHDTAHLRFYRNGALIEAGTSGRGTFPMVPEEAEYRVELDWSRAMDGWHTSTRVDTAWSFVSAGSPVQEVLPLLLAEYGLAVDETNRLTSNEVHLHVRHQAGSAGSPVTEVDLEASFDEGASWLPAALREEGDGRFTAWLPLPENDAEYVTFRINAEDGAGSRIEQTIYRVAGWAVDGEAEGPDLAVAEPANGLHTNAPSVTVAGTAVDAAGGPVTVTAAGYEMTISEDGSFHGEVPLPEADGPFEILIAASNARGGITEETRTVNVDRTPPALDEGSMEPAEDVTLAWGESIAVGFTGEPGLAASYRVMAPGDSLGFRPVPPPLVPMVEVDPGVYEGIYTAPAGKEFTGVRVEIRAEDLAGNTARADTPGRITVVAEKEEEPEPDPVEPPSLVITEPADGLLTNRDSIKVAGIAADPQEGQEIIEVTVNGRAAEVAADGSFSIRLMLQEGANTITATAVNSAGRTATESVTVHADWTPPQLSEKEPAEDMFLFPGQTATFRFVSEPGLTAAFQVIVGGRHGTWYGRDVPVLGTPMTEVLPGVYEGTYVALPRQPLNRAIVQFNASDPAGNVTMTTAPGQITILGGLPIM